MRSIFVLLCFVHFTTSTTRIFGVKNRNVTLNCDFNFDDVKHCVWTHGGDTLEYAIGTQNLTEIHYWNVELDPKGCGITLKNLGFHHEEGKWQCHRVNNFGVTHDPVDYFVHVVKPPILLLKFNGSTINEVRLSGKPKFDSKDGPRRIYIIPIIPNLLKAFSMCYKFPHDVVKVQTHILS